MTKIVQRAAPKTIYFLSFWQNVQNENIVRISTTFTRLFLLENLFWEYNFSKLRNNNRISFSAISFMLNFYHQRKTIILDTDYRRTMTRSQNLYSPKPNLFKILCVMTWAWLFWPPWLWRLLEAKNNKESAHFGMLSQRSVHPTVPFLLTKRNWK